MNTQNKSKEGKQTRSAERRNGKQTRRAKRRERLRRADYKLGLGLIERSLASNWLNPLATIYLNLRSFPLRQALRLPMFVYGRPKFYALSGAMRIEGSPVRPGMIRFNRTFSGAPSNMAVRSEIKNTGTIVFRGPAQFGTGDKICVVSGATLTFGSDFRMSDMINIGCHREIRIGSMVRVAHRCQIFDSNYHFIANLRDGTVPRCAKRVRIGRGCWICNSTTITGGTVLPNYSIVASNSLVSKDFSSALSGSMFGGIPARPIVSAGLRRINNPDLEAHLHAFYADTPDGIYHIPADDNPRDYW